MKLINLSFEDYSNNFSDNVLKIEQMTSYVKNPKQNFVELSII